MTVVNLILIQFGFAVLVVIDVFLFVASYLVWFLAGIALRYKEPDMPRPFKIPGGNKFFVAIFIAPIIICVATFFINGSTYMIGGCIGAITGPVTYFIFKKMYGGINNSTSIIKKDKISAVSLTLVTVLILAVGIGMHQQYKAAATETVTGIYDSYYSQSFDMDAPKFDIGEDSFVSYMTLKSDEETVVEVWYYDNILYGRDLSGYVSMPGEYNDKAEFAAAVYGVMKILQNTDEGMPLDSIEFEDDAGDYFYAEYGAAYNSAADVLNAME